MSHSLVEIYVHVIFATKDRESIIPDNLEARLYSYIGALAKENKSQVININGTNDHIHILLKLHPDTPLSTLIKEIKSYSTSWIKKNSSINFSWQLGYAGYSCSKSHVEKIFTYINNQKEHHKIVTFQEELDNLKRKMGLKTIP